MERIEDFAQEALKYLDLAQRFEGERKLEKAIENYQIAADLLKRSGFLTERITDIYSRIEELNTFLREEKKYQQMQLNVELDKLQDQAFALLDGGSKFEKRGAINDAITQYNSAISLLVKAGWSESQLENLKMKIAILMEKLEHQKFIQEQPKFETLPMQNEIPTETQPQVVSAFGQKKDALKAEELKKFKESKEKEEQIQNDAFMFIENAKFFERARNYQEAIENYEQAISLLNSIGWQEQTGKIQLIVDKLKKEKADFEKFQSQQRVEKTAQTEERLLSLSGISLKDASEKGKISEFEAQQSKEEKIQTDAFNLIDVGKKLEVEKKYGKAIQSFEKAINLLKSIGWDSYIQPIMIFIKDIKEKQKYENEIEYLVEKREEDAKKIQETIFSKEREETIQNVQEIEEKRKKYEQKRREELEKESKFIATLDNADKILHENKDYAGAIREYQKALDYILNLGSGWQSYINTIKATIESVKKLKEEHIEKDLEIQKRIERGKQQDLEYQQQISLQLQKEREKIKKKAIDFEIRKDELEYREQRKEAAFKTLEDAQDYIKKEDLDNAILAYQNAGNIFAGIQWKEGIPLVENAIFELERRKQEILLMKQKDLQKSIEKFKIEKAFQEKIAKEMQIEREKLKAKEIRLREREKELEHREKRKAEAFNLLEEAQKHLTHGNFEKTIELYHSATAIFAEIQWYDEVELIGKAIIEIENKKREVDLKKQKDLQILLEKEREDREFQERIAYEMKTQKERLTQRKIALQEIEKEVEIREHKKEEAFSLIEKAQHFLSLGKFEESIDLYREVASIFAQIQWNEELPLIQQAIREVEAKKQEKELWKQKSMKSAIKKEASNRIFIEKIIQQREIEKLKIQNEKELIEKRKKLSAENISKQENAFRIIEEADVLLKQEEFDKPLEEYQKAIQILIEIGWEGNYLKLLKENVQEIIEKKQEKENRIKLEKEYARKQIEEEILFEKKVSQQIQKQQERLRAKKIEIQRRDEYAKQMELLKSNAFDLMDKAEILLHQGLYEQSIDLYFQAELILSEIQFPTDAIKEMIQKIQEKKREEDLSKHYEMELMLKKLEEDKRFQKTIVENMQIEKEKMKLKQIHLKQQEELKEHLEKRKEDAFDLLGDAEIFMKQANYDKALQYYRSAELVLNEIQFPTNSLKELILKVTEKKREQELQKQKELEFKVKMEREEFEFQKKVTENLMKEKNRLKFEQIKVKKLEQVKAEAELKKEEAYKILDEAENYMKISNYDQAINLYRKATLMLNELQFPTNAINEMIIKVSNLKKQQEVEKELRLQQEFDKLEQEKKLQTIYEERKKQEMERRVAVQLALHEKERLVQEQLTHREAAYSLLEEATQYLKGGYLDYDKAISLYIQARDLLAEKIGWEPEINNLNSLIKDLNEEKARFFAKKKLEENLRLQRQRDYELFQMEVQKRREEYKNQKISQQKKLKDLFKLKQNTERIREEGLNLIDKGKEMAIYHDFEKAYRSFNKAIAKFKEIGWEEQTKYIQKEIENTKTLQEKVEKEDLRVQKIYEELQSKKLQQQRLSKERDKQLKHTLAEVGDLADEVSKLIENRKQSIKLKEKQQKEQIEQEAKQFSNQMAKMLKFKQELMDEIEKSKRLTEKQKEDLKRDQDKQRAEEIKKMLKEVAKRKKK